MLWLAQPDVLAFCQCISVHAMHAGPVPVDVEAENSIDTFATAVSHETSFASAGSRAVGSIAGRHATPAAPRDSHAAATSRALLAAPPATPPALHTRPSAAAASPATVVEPADWQAALQQLAFASELLVLLPPSCASRDPAARPELERLLPLCLHLATAAACGGDTGPGQSSRVRACVCDLAVACVGQYATAACWHTRWKDGDGGSASLWSVGAPLRPWCPPELPWSVRRSAGTVGLAAAAGLADVGCTCSSGGWVHQPCGLCT